MPVVARPSEHGILYVVRNLFTKLDLHAVLELTLKLKFMLVNLYRRDSVLRYNL